MTDGRGQRLLKTCVILTNVISSIWRVMSGGLKTNIFSHFAHMATFLQPEAIIATLTSGSSHKLVCFL